MILSNESKTWSSGLNILKLLDSAAQVPHGRPEERDQATIIYSFDRCSSFDLLALTVRGRCAPHDVGKERIATGCLQILCDKPVAILSCIVARVFLRFHCVKNRPCLSHCNRRFVVL